MVTYESLLRELPLPASWDHNLFALNGKYTEANFRDLLLHAKERSTYVSRGSSRAVFKVTYENRPTVLKLAMNEAGMAQNKAEAGFVFGSKTKDLSIIIPGIDYDTHNAQPVWIHEEYARPVTEQDVHTYLGTNIIADAVDFVVETRSTDAHELASTISRDNETQYEFIIGLRKLLDIVKFDTDFLADIRGRRQWGIYQHRLVLLDLGLTSDTSDYYRSGPIPSPPSGTNLAVTP